ncbi:MAG: HigA family addiction module antidote protein [Treponema sp.]|jgi:addiction module HigA family antidote|nr:HigA family addiction module antidote protein [Treponema sp.]
MPKTKITPAAEISRLMEKYNLNPFSLSKMLNVSNSSVRAIVNNKTVITIPMAFRLAQFFGQTPDYWIKLQTLTDIEEAADDKKLQVILRSIPNVKNISNMSNREPGAKNGKKYTLRDKRKQAAKIPGARPASRKRK